MCSVISVLSQLHTWCFAMILLLYLEDEDAQSIQAIQAVDVFIYNFFHNSLFI